MRTWPFALPTAKIIPTASDLLNRFSLSYWDAMLLAACIESGVKRLYTKDFSGYPNIDGVEIINPFRTA